MHVLDIGCGPGDVTFMAADLVGPTGRVTGIDRSDDVVQLARARAETAGYSNVEFSCTSLEALPTSVHFDAVVCRYVLVHQSDPVAFVASASRLVRSGGLLAMHEMDVSRGWHSSPRVPLMQQAQQWATDVLTQAGVAVDAGGRLVQIFADAQLPTPFLLSENVVEHADRGVVCNWITGIVRSLLPEMIRSGLVSGDFRVTHFEEELRAAVTEAPTQVEFVPQICAWVHL